MGVEHGLARVRADVEHEAIPALGYAALRCDSMGGTEDGSQELGVLDLADAFDVLQRHYQDMHGRLGIDIVKGHDVLIAIDGLEGWVGG